MIRASDELRRARDSQVAAGDYVPMGAHVSDTVVKLVGGHAYLASWRVDGLTFETRDPDEIIARKEAMNNFLRSLDGGRWSVWTHKIRRHVRERMDGHFENAFCAELIRQYYATFDRHRQMATELYFTLVYRPDEGRLGGLRRRREAGLEQRRAREDEAIATLDDLGRSFETSFADYGVRRLGTTTRNDVVFSEMAALYGYLVNGVWENVPLRRASLNDYLPSSRLHFGDRNGLLEIWHPNAHKFAGFLDIQEYPSSSEPGMTSSLLYADYEYIETQSFSILAKRDGVGALKTQRGHLIASDDGGADELAAIDEAIDALRSGHFDVGEYHYTLAVLGDSPQEVSTRMAEARSSMADVSGIKMAIVDAIPECAWFAQLPGNWRMRSRDAKLTTRNFASLAPLHNFGSGKRDGNPWGEALALMQTPSGQPYYLNFHASPPKADSTDEKIAGNTFICGSTGVGKTTLQMALLASATKYPGFRCMLLDLDRGAEIGIRAMGGKYSALVRGQKTGFNPFQMPPTSANESFCVRLVSTLIASSDGQPLSAREEDQVRAAVHGVLHELPLSHRRLAAVDQMLFGVGDNSMKLRLKKWIAPNALGWVFDNPIDTQDFGSHAIYGYDYSEFLDDPEIRTPILMYLLHVSETLKDGRPFIRIIEEFWKALRDETLMAKALQDVKTDRKLSALGIYVTQSPSDVLTSPIGQTLIEQCDTQIYLPNPRANPKDYIEGFRVTTSEFELIRGLDPKSRTFLVKQGHSSSLVSFDLTGMTDMLNVISGSLDNVRLLDEIRAEVGDDPQVWLPVFHQRIAQRRASMREWSQSRRDNALSGATQ